MNTTFCKKCGAQNPDDNQFCSQCGGSLLDVQKSADSKYQSNQSGYIERDKTVGGKKLRVLTLVIIIVIMLIAVFYYYDNFIKPNPQSNEEVTWTSNFIMVDSSGSVFTIDTSGTVFTIHSTSYVYQLFWSNLPVSLSGTFSSPAGVTAYIVDASEWNSTSNFNSIDVPRSSVGSYYYTTGDVTTGSINTNLAAGTYYLLIFPQ